MRRLKSGGLIAAAILIHTIIIAWKVFASVQFIYPSGNGSLPADGATGRWTTQGGGTTAWGRCTDGTYTTGVKEASVNDVCTISFADYTLPGGAVVSSVDVFTMMCLFSGASVTGRVDIYDGTTFLNGTAAEGSALDEFAECSTNRVDVFATAPDGSAWDQTDINNLQVRLVLTAASGAGNIFVSECEAHINYSLPTGGVRRVRLQKTR